MAEQNAAGVDRLDDEDEALAAILAESRDSYLKEQFSILKSIQELSINAEDEQQTWERYTSNTLVSSQNHDYGDTAWNRDHHYCSAASSSFESDRCRRDDRKMPRKIDSRSETSLLDPWCSTSTMNTSPTTATEFSNDDVIQEQIRILQEIQGNAVRDLSTRENDSQDEEIRNVSSSSATSRQAKTSSSGKQEISPYEDQTLHLFDGSKVRVRGMKQVFSSIAQGDSIFTACTACGTISQVPATARALYCTLCREISPVVPMDDGDLARSIQRREKECHCKR